MTAAAASAAPVAPDNLPDVALRADVLLIGEVHDNGEQHARRARWLRQLSRDHAFALAMEQFDVPRQPDIDRALADGLPARELAERAGFRFKGWQWDFYEPAIALAIERRLPLWAANLASADLMAIARGQAAKPSLLTESAVAWSETDQSRVSDEIREGHCGTMPEAMVPAMVTAQRARDAAMAQVVFDAHRRTGLPVVLLAGNGHVRNDLGVPRYLKALWPQARVVSIGLLEAKVDESTTTPAVEAPAEPFDLSYTTPAAKREDPCEDLRRRGKNAPAKN